MIHTEIKMSNKYIKKFSTGLYNGPLNSIFFFKKHKKCTFLEAT